MTISHQNRLAEETSPYLQQHAHNPVDWFPWCQEAIEKARQENKPILLSIGYAACHWCHVMAHESFEDNATAELMNKLFVNIKVDREERPDLDKVYQTSHYLLTQRSGGWPLTIFLTPEDLTPFFSGTYFPREPRHQLPAFKDVLKALSEAYREQAQNIRQQNAEIQRMLQHQFSSLHTEALDDSPIKAAFLQLQRSYDKIFGGFGMAPKFPQASRLELLLTKLPAYAKGGKEMALTTLKHMAEGGIYDQLQGGFYRYSVDAKWQIPHFEKMLYDNAQLLILYVKTGFTKIAKETADWMIECMQSPEGGYYSSIDADSEGHEGKYYVWDRNEVELLLTKEEFELARHYYGFDCAPNFEKHWHLFVSQSLESVATLMKITLAKATTILNSANKKLLAVRSKRIAPAVDKKILTSWNALAIKAMVTTGYVLHEARYRESAERALAFIHKTMWVNHRLFASYKDGKAHLAAYLDDYVFLLDALLTALQYSWDEKKLSFAIELAEAVLNYFYDETTGSCYFTANDHEVLLYRPKTFADEALPAGNAVFVRTMFMLGHLLGETRYLDAAEKTLRAAWSSLQHYPTEHATLLLGLEEYLNPPPIVVLRGSLQSMQAWQEYCLANEKTVFAIPESAHQLPGTLALREPVGNICAYVCKGTECQSVVEDFDTLKKIV